MPVQKKPARKKTATKKAAPKKTAPKKTAPKKTATKKAAPKKTAPKKTAPKKGRRATHFNDVAPDRSVTQREFLTTVAAILGHGFTAKQIRDVYGATSEALIDVLRRDGRFRLPELALFTVKDKPARAAGEQYNPFTKQMQYVGPKPASRVVKVRPAKELRTL